MNANKGMFNMDQHVDHRDCNETSSRRAYSSPFLVVHGDAVRLTATGTVGVSELSEPGCEPSGLQPKKCDNFQKP